MILALTGELDNAVALSVKDLAVTRKARGELHEEVVESLKLMVRLHERREDWTGARKALAELLSIRQRQPDQKDWRIGDARRALADVDRRAALGPAPRQRLKEAGELNRQMDALYGRGKYADAIDPGRKAMEIRGDVLGKDSEEYARSMNGLAEIYWAIGDFAKVEALQLGALDIRKRVLGESHPDYGESLANLAALYTQMGKYAKAEPVSRQALETTKRVLGENNREYATDLNNLGMLYYYIENYAKAEPMLRQALEVRRRVLGENDSYYAQSLNNLGLLYQAMKDYAKAEPLCRQALDIRKREPGVNHPDYAESLGSLAHLYDGMADYVKAEPLYRQALEIQKRALGENHPNYAATLRYLARMHQAMCGDEADVIKLAHAGKLDDMVEAELNVLAIERRVMGELHEDVVASLELLTRLEEARGDWSAARKALTEVLAIRQRQPDRKDWRIGDAKRDLAELDQRESLRPGHRRRLQEADRLNRLQHALFQQGRYTEGIDPCRNAMEIRGELLGQEHPGYATSLSNLGALYNAVGDSAKAEPLYRQALEIWKRALGENHPNCASGLNNLAALYQDLGDYAKAEPLYRRAAEIRSRALGENHPEYASSLSNLGLLYQNMGDYAKAAPLFRNAVDIHKRALSENNADYANSVNSLAVLYKEVGDYAKAEPLLRQALEIRRRTLSEQHPDYANSLNNLAALYEAMGYHAKAEPLYCRALEIRKLALGEKHPDYASSLNNLATLYQAMGEYAKTEPLVRQALETYKRALGEDHPDYATSLNNLASLYQSMGNDAKAEPMYRQALEVYKRSLGENHPKYANSLIRLASFYLSEGQLAAAAQSYSQGLTLLTRWTQEGLAAFGERQRTRLIAARAEALNGYLSVAPAAGIQVEEIYRHVLAWKGVVEAREDEDRLARDQPELKETLGQLAQARARLANLAFTAPPAGERQTWIEQLDALRDRKENLESDLARKSGAFRSVQETRRLGAAEVATALAPGTVLVDLLVYSHASPPEGGKGPLRWERRLAAFVLRRGQALVLVPLGASGPIDQPVRAWRQALVAGTAKPRQAAALELNRRVWEPLKPHLEGATTVLVAPDGALLYFPLAALPGRRPGTYLVEDVAIDYVSSAHRLVATFAAPSEGRPKSTGSEAAGLLAIGGIDYQADPGSAAPTESAPTPSVFLAESQRAGFTALAGTEPEVRRIGQLFDAAFPRQYALVLTGAAPTEAAVKEQLGRHWRHLHLATHGFFESPARVAAMRMGLKSDSFGPVSIGKADESAALELAPLLHSGVALAGAARTTEATGFGSQGILPEREDGILTDEEVQSLDMRGTDLVVLSACETGLGKGYYGQGVMGLQRAFQAAGARAVVASLWKVDDTATTVLMEQFYINLWTKKMPKLEALRQAQLTVLNDPGLVRARRAELAKRRGINEKPEKLPEGGRVAAPDAQTKRSDPALWASFVLSGDGR